MQCALLSIVTRRPQETFSEGPEDDSLAKEVVVSDADLIKSGAMTKQGGIRKNWKKRFFKLSIVQLAYYTTDAKQKFKGGIPLEMVSLLLTSPPTARLNLVLSRCVEALLLFHPTPLTTPLCDVLAGC